MNIKTLPSVRRFLLAFGVAILMPVLGFAGLLLWNYAQSERAQYDAQASVAANNLIAAVESEKCADWRPLDLGIPQSMLAVHDRPARW